jgi:hypothetical protein
MTIQNATEVRFYCTKHGKALVNVGSGDILYDTNGPYVRDEQGWWEFDMSEYSCLDWKEDSDDCSEFHEVQVKTS